MKKLTQKMNHIILSHMHAQRLVQYAFYMSLFLLLAWLPMMLLAQGADTTGVGGGISSGTFWTSLLPLFITGLVAPLGMALIKKWFPAIPKLLIPVLVMLLPGVIGFLLNIFNAWQGNPVLLALGGTFGLWLREILDQAKKSMPADA